MAEYEVLDDNWNIGEHFNYGSCQEDAGEKIYVLCDENGNHLCTKRTKDEILREASKRDIKLHMRVTVLPLGGVVLGSIKDAKQENG